jgi:hypothetical protein
MTNTYADATTGDTKLAADLLAIRLLSDAIDDQFAEYDRARLRAARSLIAGDVLAGDDVAKIIHAWATDKNAPALIKRADRKGPSVMRSVHGPALLRALEFIGDDPDREVILHWLQH